MRTARLDASIIRLYRYASDCIREVLPGDFQIFTLVWIFASNKRITIHIQIDLKFKYVAVRAFFRDNSTTRKIKIITCQSFTSRMIYAPRMEP